MAPKYIKYQGQWFKRSTTTVAESPKPPKRELGTCQACGKSPATDLYSISPEETYELCTECLEAKEEAAATGELHELCIVCEKPCVPGEDPYDLDELQRHVHEECYNSWDSADEYYADTKGR